jgi:2-dehydropantoate 2-reductase
LNVAIWGAGSVGIGLASGLVEPGSTLRILARNPATRRALVQHGIERSGILGTVEVPPEALNVVGDSGSFASEAPDWLLICTKTFANPVIAAELAAFSTRMGGRTRVVLCQNGWGNEEPFLPIWPSERLFHARIITGFHRRADHHVEITAHAAPVALGSLFGDPIDGLEPLAETLTRGGIPAQVRRDMESVLWAKMLYNCALNPLGALTNRSYGELAEAANTRELMARVVEEIFAVLEPAGYRVAWADADSYLETFYSELIPTTAAHRSSMLQDLRAGRRTEIEALCGAVERLALRHRVATPVVSALARLVRIAERRPEGSDLAPEAPDPTVEEVSPKAIPSKAR